MQRRLAVILASDVVDYTRLMGEDGAGTLAVLNQLRQDLFQPKVDGANGTVVKRMGDGWLVEFTSVSDAVDCGIAIQQGLADQDLIRLRIGIHIGDVSFQDDDIYGDGINVASRLEALAQPGQVLISDTVHHSLDEKLRTHFSGGDARELKNVNRPVAVWCWPETSASAAPAAARNAELAAMVSKPSIAVLPFDNMSGDPEQEFFADGMTEDIITALSKFHALMVTARNSTFAYKGQSPDIHEVGTALGVRYVLEGSVRKAGNRIRVTAQLIDTASGSHSWAERYDRKIDDIFDLQDEMTSTIAAAVDAGVRQAEAAQHERLLPENLDAWANYHRGLTAVLRVTKENHADARSALNLSIGADPKFALAHAALALTYMVEVTMAFTSDAADTVAKGIEHSKTALDLDDNEAFAHTIHGRLLMLQDKSELGLAALNRAIALNSNLFIARYNLAQAHVWLGNTKECIENADIALKLSPRDALVWACHLVKSMALTFSGRIEEGIAAALESVKEGPQAFWSHGALIYARVGAGDVTAAEKSAQEILNIDPDFTVAGLRKSALHVNPELINQFCDGLATAGIPRE